MPTYFTGKSVTDRTLVSADAAGFRDLVNRLIDNPIRLAITHDEYHELKRREEDVSLTQEQRQQAKRERDRHKQVPYLVACTFSSSPWEGRHLDAALDCHLIFLDVDDKSHAETILADTSPLAAFNHVIYRTITSTKDHPRIRVVVEADSIPVARYPEAVSTIARTLGLPGVTRESKVVVQPMYRPSVFADHNPDTDHPVTHTHYSGRAFTLADIREVTLEEESVETPLGEGEVIDYLLWYKSPLEGVSSDNVKDMLDHINPDCGYMEWITVAMALRHQFSANLEDGLRLFDEWSQTGAKYAGRDDTETKWSQVKEQPKGRAPVTIRSLFKMATEGGWSPAQVTTGMYSAVEDWITSAKSKEQILRHGIPRIAATPTLSAMEEESLMNLLILYAREQFGIRLSLGNLRKALKDEKNRIRSMSEDKVVEKQVSPWARGIAYVASRNEFFRPRTQQMFSPESFDRMYGRELLPTAEQLVEIGRDVTDAALNTPLYKPSDYVLNHLKCQTCDDYLYDPANPDKTYTKHDSKTYVNTYLRDYRTSDPSRSAYAEDIIMDHMHNLIKEEENVEGFLDWMSYLVQYPGVKIRYALFLQGAKGCGKTFVAEILRSAIGASNVKVINQNTFAKGWNEWATGSQLVAIEEIRAKGHNRHDTMEILKEPITNDYISINERGVNTRTVRNFTNYLIFSNWRDALAVTDDERRYHVVMSRMQKEEQVRELVRRDPEYFVRIAHLLRVHPGGVRHFLENRSIRDSFQPNGPAPRTTYLAEMVEDTSSELVVTIKQIIEEKESPAVSRDAIAPAVLKNCLVMHGLDDVSSAYLSTTLREMGYSRTSSRHTVMGDRQHLWLRADCDPEATISNLNKQLDETGEAGQEM